MHQLRTPKTMAGPELGNPALYFRAWYETLNGPAAFDALDRIPRLAWADYLDWFQQVTGTTVRHGTRLVEIEPQGDLLRLTSRPTARGASRRRASSCSRTAMRAPAGRTCPSSFARCPRAVWTHTTGNIPFAAWHGKVVGVVGAGSIGIRRGGRRARERRERSASLQPPLLHRLSKGAPPAGAQPAAPLDRGYGNMLELSYELPDVVRWRNFLLGDRRVASVPLDSVERAVAFKDFHIHLDSSVSDVARRAATARSTGRVGNRAVPLRPPHRGDGLSHRSRGPTRARAHPRAHRAVARPVQAGRRRRKRGGRQPSVPRRGVRVLAAHRQRRAEYLRNIHCFNLAGALSFGIPVGDVPSVVDQPRLITAIARDLYVEGVDVAAHERFINAPLAAPSPAPYERAVATRATRSGLSLGIA